MVKGQITRGRSKYYEGNGVLLFFLFIFFPSHFPLGSVWSPESSMERKKNGKENYFLMFGFTMKNIKKIKYNQNFSKFYIFL